MYNWPRQNCFAVLVSDFFPPSRRSNSTLNVHFMINPERLCQDFMQMWQSKGRLARVLSHYGTVLKLSNAPSAQAPQSPRVALSEPCSWRVEGAPSCIVLICHESEAGLPKGSRMLARWSPQTAAPPLISQMGAKMASRRNKHPHRKEKEPLVTTAHHVCIVHVFLVIFFQIIVAEIC